MRRQKVETKVSNKDDPQGHIQGPDWALGLNREGLDLDPELELHSSSQDALIAANPVSSC